MKKLKIYQADAFTKQLFEGNPAAVIPLETWLPDSVMQHIAAENNLAETAFIVPTGGKSDYHLRWFTPYIEVRLCGHATLATAHILFEQLGFDKSEIRFDSLSGILTVTKQNDGLLTLNFPTDILRGYDLGSKEATIIYNILSIKPLAVFRGRDDFMAVLPSESDVASLKPNFAGLKNLDARGLIATAKGDTVDFVSRCFFPEAGVEEDPVTGSAHTTMIPYWAKKLDKNRLFARQISLRGGNLVCVLRDERVDISGYAVTYLIGDIFY
ncbi:MAG: PhzF family phenazine biosynthesis protein [Saprospiraceae bacterium]|nr:PhzF family phenazine biosynthesis protein [Saprospiraceae bacterium]